MKIAVYSGSFNPLHIGHLAIMRHLTQEAGFDWVDLIVSPKNPIKDSISEDSAQERYEAAIEAVVRHPELRVWVDDIELHMPSPQYTIRTLDALKEREPENEFTLVIGGDNLAGIRRWRDYKRILTDYGVVVFPRTGFDSPALKADLETEWSTENDRTEEDSMTDCSAESGYRIRLLEAGMVDISSTEIREGIAEGRDMSEFLM